ncbi:MAG: hypothetical protein JNJ73_02910 [Hyphomonadaceae bacterium]|nr:hypothetical protein [Hyphomonadaceae bacterium]
MKKTIAFMASAAALALASPAAAQQWMSLEQRQANIDARIDAGIRDGSLSAPEAARLRAEFRDLIVLETQHRRSGGGLDARERLDLDQRYDALAARINVQRHDAQGRPGPGGPGYGQAGPGPVPALGGGWRSINERQADLDARIDRGVRDGSLSRGEAIRLRSEFNNIAALEAQYRRTGGGLDPRERADLDRRFDALSAQIRFERTDGQGRPGGPGRPGGWWNINERQAELDRRIDRGVRDGTLTRAEAARLRNEYRTLVGLEANYRRSGGLNEWERNDLNRRFDLLAARIRWERSDWDRGWDRR